MSAKYTKMASSFDNVQVAALREDDSFSPLSDKEVSLDVSPQGDVINFAFIKGKTLMCPSKFRNTKNKETVFIVLCE